MIEQHVATFGGCFTPTQLWSPLRTPLARFLGAHPTEAVTYFLNLQDRRIFSKDYFWLLYDLVQDDAGAPLLRELCASADLWAALLSQVTASFRVLCLFTLWAVLLLQFHLVSFVSFGLLFRR